MASKLFSLRSAVLLALSLGAASVQAVDVTVAYQTSAEPAKVAQAENSFAKQSGATVDWRKFDSGSSVLRALASGGDDYEVVCTTAPEVVAELGLTVIGVMSKGTGTRVRVDGGEIAPGPGGWKHPL